MKNPSNRVSELKKGDFKPLENFFLKIHGFSVKKWKWIKNGQKIPKKFEIRSRHDFLLFLSYELIKSKILGFWAILRHFSSFLVGTLKGPIRRCTCRWIWIFWSKLCSMGSKLYLRFYHPRKLSWKICVFWQMKFGHFCTIKVQMTTLKPQIICSQVWGMCWSTARWYNSLLEHFKPRKWDGFWMKMRA